MRAWTPALLSALLSALLPLTAGSTAGGKDHAQQDVHPRHHAHPHGPGMGVAALSAELRAALAAEMAALQAGMIAAIPAIVAGQWDEVARIGAQMRDSYILAQTLSEAQRQELHDTLPASFLELDARFHYLAGMLSHTAEAKKPELVAFYFSAMTETCVRCHASHALEKFPALADLAPAPHHAH